MERPGPAIPPLAPASVSPSGMTPAAAVPLARSTPKSEMMEPGASGALAANLAPLTAAPSTGDLADSPNPPETSPVPTRFHTESFRQMTIFTGPILIIELQVVDPKLPTEEYKDNGGPPYHN